MTSVRTAALWNTHTLISSSLFLHISKMKLRGTIKESIRPADNTVIVQFDADTLKQHFEVKCNFNPYQEGLRKWDSWDFWIKWESEIFTDQKTGEKSYFTHLICHKAMPFFQIGNGK